MIEKQTAHGRPSLSAAQPGCTGEKSLASEEDEAAELKGDGEGRTAPESKESNNLQKRERGEREKGSWGEAVDLQDVLRIP